MLLGVCACVKSGERVDRLRPKTLGFQRLVGGNRIWPTVYSSDIFEFTRKMPDTDKEWVTAFFRGEKPDVRLDLLTTIANELEAPEAIFVGRAVTHLLS